MPRPDDEGRDGGRDGGDLRGEGGGRSARLGEARSAALEQAVEGLAGDVEGLERGLDVLGRIVGRLARQVAGTDEVVARRLTVVDDRAIPRMVAEVVDDTMELRLELPGTLPGRRSAVVLHASRSSGPGPGGSPGEPSAGSLLGLQVWADGDAVAELDAWPDEEGRWRAQLHLDGD